MKEQTIYSYKLLFRLRWRLIGPAIQFLLLLIGLFAAARLTAIPLGKLFVSLSVVAAVPFLHFFLYRLYAYAHSHTAKLSLVMLFSPWWGVSTPVPVSLSFFRGVEFTVCAGSLLAAAALYVWLPPGYGIALVLGSLVLCIPRLAALVMSLGKPKRCRIKYDSATISFMLTDG
ncbi:hypothetical protein ACTID9_00255 [Brevibacillus fluminis]|uniref:hypothetical protein n=1 Tax=Brevibacillus fluminis TaxID=511487 RepID=UPI003F8CCEE7